MNLDTNTIVIVVAVLAALIVAFLLLRPKKARVELAKPEGDKPYVANRDRPYVNRETAGVTGEVAAATTDVAGQVLDIPAHRELGGSRAEDGADDLQRLKGVGPKFAARLNELGLFRYKQIADLSESEVALLDEKMGPFRGRLLRDRVIEQADYLARGDTDGFEARFGNLGGA